MEDLPYPHKSSVSNREHLIPTVSSGLCDREEVSEKES